MPGRSWWGHVQAEPFAGPDGLFRQFVIHYVDYEIGDWKFVPGESG